MQEQLERIARDLRPSYLDWYDKLARTLEPFRQNNLAVISQIGTGYAQQVYDIAEANQHVVTLFDRVRADAEWILKLERVHESWKKQIEPLTKAVEHVKASSALSLAASSQMLSASESLLSRLVFDKWQRAFRFSDDLVNQLEQQLAAFTTRFDGLVDSVQELSDLTILPSFVLPGASREVYVTSHALVELSPDRQPDEDQPAEGLLSEVEEESSWLVARLEQIDPGLANSYRGAREALASGNVDRARHVLVSLRELWSHLLRRIAPDDVVLDWASCNPEQLIHRGKPTRQARVLYVCRGINHPPLSDFLEEDTRALVTMVQFFNRVHDLDAGLTDEQLEALLVRTDSWLIFILRISESV